MSTGQQEVKVKRKLLDLISSVSSAVSGVSQPSVAYHLSTVLNDLTAQLTLPPEQRNISPILDRLSEPELAPVAQSFHILDKVEEMKQLERQSRSSPATS
jgi:hypothetical protein